MKDEGLFRLLFFRLNVNRLTVICACFFVVVALLFFLSAVIP